MKKIIFSCFCILLASCSSYDELQEMKSNEGESLPKELESITNDYELTLKGYSFDELKKEKDEITPTTQEETEAEPWLIKAIHDSISQIQFNYNNRTRTDARAYAGVGAMEGVFKYETCGSYREFVYHMDCEDGGDTYSTGSIGATSVDSNGNVVFHFCVIPGSLNYAGGTLVFYQPALIFDNVYVVKRSHDNEDHNNKNEVQDNGGLSSFGPNYFGKNTDFFWKISLGGTPPKLPFKYGMLGNGPLVAPKNILWIDDENGKNANQAIVWHANNNIGTDLPADQNFHGITPGKNTTYEIVIH